MITANAVMNSSRFIEIAAPEAIEVVAKANGATYAEIAAAYANGVATVRENVASLLWKAAEESAEAMNHDAA